VFRHVDIKSRRQEITQKKAYNIQNKAKVWCENCFPLAQQPPVGQGLIHEVSRSHTTTHHSQ
jgi:hypothetical protein